MGFPSGSEGKEPACNAGDLGSIPGLGRSAGEGNGNPLQHSCLENSMDRGVWQATVHEKYFCGDHFQAINVTSLNSVGKDNTVAHAVEYFSCTNTVTITQEHR